MLPLSVRKRMNPDGTRSPLCNVGNVQEFSASPSTAKIIQTSPQRRAFSKILQMLHTANSSRCTCNKENERLAPKLIKLLKQAKKEKNQLEEKLELTMLKARRDVVAASNFWGEKVGNLKLQHATTLQKYKAMMASNAEECHHLRARNEELVKEAVLAEKRLISLQAETTDDAVKHKSEGSRDMSTIMKLLEAQLEERNGMLQHERLQKVEVKVAHESQLRSIREEYAQVMETVNLQLSHAMQILHEVQEQKDSLTRGTNIHRLHEELAVISRTIQNSGVEWSPRARGTTDEWTPRASGTIETQGTELTSPVSSSTVPLPATASDVFEDCVMDDEDDDRPLMVFASSESRSCESSPTERHGGYLRFISVASPSGCNMHDVDPYKQVVDQLEEKLEAAEGIQVGLQHQIDHLQAELESASMELSRKEKKYDNENFRFQQELELSQAMLREEKQARQVLHTEYESLCQKHDAMTSTTAMDALRKEQVVSDLTRKLENTTFAVSKAEAEAKEVQETLKRMEHDHARIVEELGIQCEMAKMEAQEKQQLMAELRSKFENSIVALSISEAEARKVHETLKQMEEEHTATVDFLRTQCENTKHELRNTTADQLQIASTLRQQLFECEQEFSVSQKSVHDLKSKLEHVQSQLEQQIANSSRELAVAHETIVELNNEVAHLEQRLDVESLRHDLEMSKEKTRHDAEMVAASKQLCEVTEEATELKTLLQQINDERTVSLQSLAKDEQEKAKVTQGANIRLHQEAAALNGQLCKAKEEIANLRIRIRAAEYKQEATLQSLEDARAEAQKRNAMDGQIKEMESRHMLELLDLASTNAHSMEDKQFELHNLQQLYDSLVQENQRLQDDLSTQLLSVEAANEAEVFVLKQYTQQLESSIENYRKALSASNSRQDDLMNQIDQLNEPTHIRSPSPIGTHGKHIGNDEKFNLFSPGGDLSRESEIQELRRGLFAADVFYESEEGEYRRRADDSSILDQSSSEPEPRGIGAHIVPCSSPEDALTSFDDCVQRADWQERCIFLESDRDDLMRVTDEIIEEERETHRLQLGAAIATAKREAAEQLLEHELCTRRQMTLLYEGLCSKCRHKIDSA